MGLSRVKRAWAVEQLTQGRSVFDIAKDLKVPPSLIRWAAKGTEMQAVAQADRATRGRFSRDQADAIVRRYSVDAVSSLTIAKEFGVGHATILRVLQRNGVDRRRGWAKVPQERTCSKCKATKPLGAFGLISTRPEAHYRTHVCRDCASRVARERGYVIKSNTGLTREQYDAMLREQDGGCAICSAPPKKIRLSVDHDHETHEVRGLLCHRCNTMMQALDDRAWMAKALAYLAKPRSGVVYKNIYRERRQNASSTKH